MCAFGVIVVATCVALKKLRLICIRKNLCHIKHQSRDRKWSLTNLLNRQRPHDSDANHSSSLQPVVPQEFSSRDKSQSQTYVISATPQNNSTGLHLSQQSRNKAETHVTTVSCKNSKSIRTSASQFQEQQHKKASKSKSNQQRREPNNSQGSSRATLIKIQQISGDRLDQMPVEQKLVAKSRYHPSPDSHSPETNLLQSLPLPSDKMHASTPYNSESDQNQNQNHSGRADANSTNSCFSTLEMSTIINQQTVSFSSADNPRSETQLERTTVSDSASKQSQENIPVALAEVTTQHSVSSETQSQQEDAEVRRQQKKKKSHRTKQLTVTGIISPLKSNARNKSQFFAEAEKSEPEKKETLTENEIYVADSAIKMKSNRKKKEASNRQGTTTIRYDDASVNGGTKSATMNGLSKLNTHVTQQNNNSHIRKKYRQHARRIRSNTDSVLDSSRNADRTPKPRTVSVNLNPAAPEFTPNSFRVGESSENHLSFNSELFPSHAYLPSNLSNHSNLPQNVSYGYQVGFVGYSPMLVSAQMPTATPSLNDLRQPVTYVLTPPPGHVILPPPTPFDMPILCPEALVNYIPTYRNNPSAIWGSVSTPNHSNAHNLATKGSESLSQDQSNCGASLHQRKNDASGSVIKKSLEMSQGKDNDKDHSLTISLPVTEGKDIQNKECHCDDDHSREVFHHCDQHNDQDVTEKEKEHQAI